MPAVDDSLLDGPTVAFLVAPEGAEQIELTEPWKAVVEAGGQPLLVSTEPGEILREQNAKTGSPRSARQFAARRKDFKHDRC